MYVVKSGQVSISADAKFLANNVLRPGDAFGDLDVLFDAPRGAHAIATGEDTSLWKIDAEIFHKNVTGKAEQTAVATISEDKQYKDFLERIQLRKMVKQCPIFKGFTSEDLERCIGTMEKVYFDSNSTVLQQGDMKEDAMYFAASDTLDCIDEKQRPPSIVNVLGKGDYFGELALLFHNPRAVTVKVAPNATEECVLWRLSRQDFNKAVQDYPLQATALEAMRTKYQETTTWKTIVRMNRSEIHDLLVAASRPKKKSVSFHSTISSVVAGMYIVLMMMHFEPGWNDTYQRFQIFRITPMSLEAQRGFRIVGALMTLVAFLGTLRIPKNSPPMRRLAFNDFAWISLALTATFDSNLFGHKIGSGGYSIDAWSWFGRLFIPAALFKALTSTLHQLDDAVCGSFRGSDSMPLALNRPLYNVAVFIIFVGLFNIFTAASYILYDHATAIAAGAPAVVQTSAVTGCSSIASLCFGALLMTMQFEKKISMKVGSLLTVAMFFLTVWDVFLFAFVRTNEAAGATLLSPAVPYRTIFWMAYALTLLNGLRKRFKLGQGFAKRLFPNREENNAA